MIPDLPNLSEQTVMAEYVSPYNREKSPLVDYARGGVALLDASKGLNVKNWVCEASDEGVYISAADVAPFKIETLIGTPSWLSFCFDQNMHYNLAYSIGAESFLYWYDATQQGYQTLSLGGISTPILRLDDVRKYAVSESSIILSYIKSGVLCVRVQNDRFGMEYELTGGAGKTIVQCGMNKGSRFQWTCV